MALCHVLHGHLFIKLIMRDVLRPAFIAALKLLNVTSTVVRLFDRNPQKPKSNYFGITYSSAIDV